MSNVIQLESRLCPNCDKTLDKWTLKVVVHECHLGVRCPSCGDFVPLTMKGGEYDKSKESEKAEAVIINETSTILKEE